MFSDGVDAGDGGGNTGCAGYNDDDINIAELWYQSFYNAWQKKEANLLFLYNIWMSNRQTFGCLIDKVLK